MPNQWLTAVVVSGGKQYRVAPGDKILVDRLAAEPGSEVSLDRVLLLDDGDEVKVGAPLIDGFAIPARVIGHSRGPKIEVLRYKSKKKVRVHRGARADLTAIEILDTRAKTESKKAATAKKAKAEDAEASEPAKPRRRAQARKSAEETKETAEVTA